MTTKNPGLFLAVSVMGLSLGACSNESTGTSSADNTAVHSAEAEVASPEELLAKGVGVYNANCAPCHQLDGAGLTGVFPPLANSDYLKADRYQVMAAALFGISGPITVNGVDYNGVMPSMGHLPDEDLAAALTYVFASWGNEGEAVSVEEVAAIRAELGQTDGAANSSR